MYDLSKENDKGFLKEANKWLQEQLIIAQLKIVELENLKSKSDEICSKLSDELHVLRQRFFANKQEKIKGKTENEKGSKGKREKKSPNLHDQPVLGDIDEPKPTLTSEDVVHTFEELNCPCGDSSCKLNEMKDCFEKSSETDIELRRYKINFHLRQKYKGSLCGKIVTAPGPAKLRPGGEFSIKMATEVACDKFERHIPLERQKKELVNHGLNIDTKTLYGLTKYLYLLLEEIPNLILKEILEGKWINVDESPMPYFNPKKMRGYIWSISNNVGTYYYFSEKRNSQIAKDLLDMYVGNIVTDAHSSYNFLDEWLEITHALCWSHLRRKFFESIVNYPQAEKVVELIDGLFEIERRAESFDDLKKLRVEESLTLYETIEEEIKNIKNGENFLKLSSLGKAINYFEKRKPGFKAFIYDPYIPLSNNKAERSQRDPVMGRKNFLAFRSINGARIGTAFYTIIGTCKTLGLNAKNYIFEMALRSARKEAIQTPFEYGQSLKKSIGEKLKSDIMSTPQGL